MDAMWPKWFVAILAISVLQGCSGHGALSTAPIVLTKPDLILKQDRNTALLSPLNISVIDEQANEGAGDYVAIRGGEYATAMATKIMAAYPNAIKAAGNVGSDSRGVFVEIRIRKLGAYVNRSGEESMLGPVDPAQGNVGDWDRAVAAAADPDPTVSGTRYKYIASNWSGVANIEISVKDLRPGHSESFHFPIMAERIRQGDLGLLRAYSVADSAWEDVGPRIASFLDAAIAKLASDERTQHAAKR
jgi:hypothetical protein